MRGQIQSLFFVIFAVLMAILIAYMYYDIFSWQARATEGLLVLQDVANFKKTYMQVLGSSTDNMSVCYQMHLTKECNAWIIKEHPLFVVKSQEHDITAAADLPVLAYGGEVQLPEFEPGGCGSEVVLAAQYETVSGDNVCNYKCTMWFRIEKERVKDGGAYKTKMRVLQHNGDGCN